MTPRNSLKLELKINPYLFGANGAVRCVGLCNEDVTCSNRIKITPARTQSNESGISYEVGVSNS